MRIGFMQGRLSPIERNRIQSFPFNFWENEIEIASKNNFKIIEWTVDSFLIDRNPIFDQSGIKKIRKLIDTNYVNIDSVTCDFFMENPFFIYKNNKINSLEYLIKLLKSSGSLGIKYFILPLVDFSSIQNKSQEELLIKEINLISKYVPRGTKILFETDFGPIKNVEFIKQFDPLFFGLNYDTGNSAFNGFDMKEEINLYYKYIHNIHIKDRKKNSDTTDLGNGHFNFDTFFSLLKSKKYKGNLILQTARSGNNQHLSLLIKNREYIENIINGLKS